MQQLDELERATLGGTRDMGPCGGFSTQYMCMCDYHALPYREEVAWDVDTIYLSHDTRELYLHDFDYLEQKYVWSVVGVHRVCFLSLFHSRIAVYFSWYIVNILGKIFILLMFCNYFYNRYYLLFITEISYLSSVLWSTIHGFESCGPVTVNSRMKL